MSNQIKTIYSNLKKLSQLQRPRGYTPTWIFRASIIQDVSIFQTFELAPPWPRITLKEHSEICSTSQYKRKISWNIQQKWKIEPTPGIFDLTLQFLDLFCDFLSFIIFVIQNQSKSLFLMFWRLLKSPDMIWNDREQNPETSFFSSFSAIIVHLFGRVLHSMLFRISIRLQKSKALTCL